MSIIINNMITIVTISHCFILSNKLLMFSFWKGAVVTNMSKDTVGVTLNLLCHKTTTKNNVFM